MHIASLDQLVTVPSRAVIINCGTREVATLALMAALRHAGMPVLLIDCESRDGSWRWFEKLAGQHVFDRMQRPLWPHGKTLDWLFSASKDESLLLIDSDLEILNADVMSLMRQAVFAPDVYGAGFLHGEEMMRAGMHTRVNPGRYMARMWIPFVLMKVMPVKDALARGSTFMHSRDYIEFPWSHFISKVLYARHRIPGMGGLSFDIFRAARMRIHGDIAPFREFDTGARVHAALLAQRYRLVDLGEPFWSRSLRHYHGVTRATMQNGQRNATSASTIRREVCERLRSVYGIDIDD